MVCCIADIRKTPLDNFTLMLKYAKNENVVPLTIFKASLDIQEEAAAMLRKSIKGSGSRTLACYDFEKHIFIDPSYIEVETQHVAYSGATEISEVEVLWCIHRLLCGLSDGDKLIVKVDEKTIANWHCSLPLYEMDDDEILCSVEKYLEQM